MRYRVVATRAIWSKQKGSDVITSLTTSRIAFLEDSDLTSNEYVEKIRQEFPGWIFNISQVK